MGNVVHSYMDRNPNGGLGQAKGAGGFRGGSWRENLGMVEDSCLLAFGENSVFLVSLSQFTHPILGLIDLTSPVAHIHQ